MKTRRRLEGRGHKPRSPGPSRSWKRPEGSPLEPREGTRPCDTLISDLWPPEPGEDNFLLSKGTQYVGLCFGCPRKFV